MSNKRPQPPVDFCYEGDPDLLPVAEARRRIHAHVQPVSGYERLALRDAFERVLLSDIVSPFDVPGHTNSAVDGYAVDGSALSEGSRVTFTNLQTTIYAGKPLKDPVAPGHCVRIMTGAVMPAGTDTVIMQENASVADGQVSVEAGHKSGQNVRQAGEDIRKGHTVLRAGVRLMPAELGLLASLGLTEVSVVRRPRVAFFSTGDELRSLGEPLALGEVYDSNRYTLFGMLRRLGVDALDMGVIPDTPNAVADAFEQATRVADVVITSGGVSTGDADYVKTTLEALGQVGFWKIAIRPGRPLAFGRIGDAVFFGLPGNPVAVMVTFYQFVQPALRQIMGELDPRPTPHLRATCMSPLRKKTGRVEYYRARIERDDNERLIVRSTGKTGSGLLHTMSDANCFIVLDENAESVAAGAEVDVQPFFGLV